MLQEEVYLGCEALRVYAKQRQRKSLSMDVSETDFPAVKALVREHCLMTNLAKDRPVLYCEGDSWFDFPGQLIPGPNNDVLDALANEHEYAVVRQSNAGDTLENMRTPENLNLLAAQMRRDKPKAFLISGGGNDVFGAGRSVSRPSTLCSIIRVPLKPKAKGLSIWFVYKPSPVVSSSTLRRLYSRPSNRASQLCFTDTLYQQLV